MRLQRDEVLEAVLTALVAVWLLFASRGRHAYGYYILLRLAATISAGYWAVRLYRNGQKGLPWPFVAVTVLLNPVLPIRMHRADWSRIDLWIGIPLLGWSAYWLIRSVTKKNQHL